MEYTGPQDPTYNCRTAQSLRFMRNIQERAHELMRDEVFFIPHVIRLVKEVIVENGGEGVDDHDFRNDVVEMLNKSKANIIVGECSGNSNYAETHPESNEIEFNMFWIVSADRLEENSTHYHNSFSLGVVKYIHEYAHVLTAAILDIDRRYRGSSRPKQSTPTKIGSKREKLSSEDKKEVWMGDMGFRLEEIMFGARIYADFQTQNRWDIAQLLAVKLVYDPPKYTNNFRYAKFKHYSIVVAAATQFKKQLINGNTRTRLFLPDDCLLDYIPPTITVTVGGHRKKIKRSAPLLIPSQEMPSSDDEAAAVYDEKYFEKHGFVDQQPANKKHKV
jgi:hypothetical protein